MSISDTGEGMDKSMLIHVQIHNISLFISHPPQSYPYPLDNNQIYPYSLLVSIIILHILHAIYIHVGSPYQS